MKHKRDDVHFSVTLERYASQHQDGRYTSHLFTLEETAKSFIATQMSTGAFIRVRLERVECVLTQTWHEWAGK